MAVLVVLVVVPSAAARLLSFTVENYPLGGSSGYGVVTGDFNRDGKLDVVSADSSDTVEFFKGKAGGKLASHPVAVNDGASDNWGLVAGRFDKGKTLDLAVADDADDEIVLLRGKGDGTFRAPLTFPVGPGPQSPAAADFNHDGHLDIAAANDDDTSVSVLLGKAHGGFKPFDDYHVCGSPYAVATGHMNGDRLPDIVTTGDNPENCVSVLLAKPNGKFEPQIVRRGLAGGPEDVITGDFNRDGRTDAATADEAADMTSVMLGKGNGHLKQPVEYAAGGGSWHIDTGHINGDRNLDLVVGNESENFLSIYLGKKNGTFSQQREIIAGQDNSPVAVANLDRHGLDDIVTNEDSNELVVLLNQG